ncbi:hypothetical protein BGW39_011292 [Mortierella sp. 14UC]|nr:hypothetical protein BGW39_011292 [Mortierella sp. 14UC]
MRPLRVDVKSVGVGAVSTSTATGTVVGSSTSAASDDISISSTTAATIINNNSNSHKEMPFYGLPPEILQHIASFLPFHGLVRLYTCLPKIHRPIFQLLLDHSLALMMLTLEIRQQSDEQPPTRHSLFVSVNNNPNGVGAARKLQTHWRVTDFDLDHMRIEFQLEEKLGLEMAERRRQEIEYQIRQNKKAQQVDPLAVAREQLERSRREQEDFENLIWRSRTGGMSSSSSTSSLIGSRRQSSSSTASTEVEVSDSNFFHCNGSSHTPTLGSATVSFKAQRNMPAPWISQYFDFADPAVPSLPSSASTSSSSASVAPESPNVIRARERVAAYQQNRLLLRALAKMRCCEESSKLQFLPVTVELETEELGQKKVEAELVEPDINNDGKNSTDVHRCPSSGHGKTSPATTAGNSSSSTIKLGRRHSWQALGSTDRPGTGTGTGASASHHHSPLEPLLSLGSDLSSYGLTKVLKRILRRSSWNGNGNISRPHTATISTPVTATTTGCSVCDPQHHHHQHHPYHQQQQQQQPQRRSMDSLRTVDWSSVFHSVASSMHRSSSSHTPTTTATVACQCPHRKAVLLTTSKQQDPATTAAKAAQSAIAVAKRRSFSNIVAGYRKGKTSTASSSETSQQQDASLSAATKDGVNKGKGKATTSEPILTALSQEQEKEREQRRVREQEQQEQHQKLFEFSYGVRHNYLHSHRLEGERVIRPMRFACSLDFFVQD